MIWTHICWLWFNLLPNQAHPLQQATLEEDKQIPLQELAALAAEAFQLLIDVVGQDLPFTFIYLYDILVATSSCEEHTLQTSHSTARHTSRVLIDFKSIQYVKSRRVGISRPQSDCSWAVTIA